MSKEQPPIREVVPFKNKNRPSTFRKLNITFAGTALEQAIAQRDEERFESEVADDPTPHHSPPLPTTPQNIQPYDDKKASVQSANSPQKTSKTFVSSGFSAKPEGEYPPVTTTPQPGNSVSIAPVKDFNRRANSLERDAMPAGLFPGSTKKVYDALYLRTLGAVTPRKTVQAARRDLLNWTGIRNLKTIDNHIRYLLAKGLIIRHWELGSNEGSSYEVRLPEELYPNQSPPLPTSGGESPPLSTTQKTSSGYTQKLGSGGEGQLLENTGTYEIPNTFNTNTDDDDNTHTLDGFMRVVIEATKSVCVGKIKHSPYERERWREFAQVLMDEMQLAASKAGSITSAPAFFTTHLKRRFGKSDAAKKSDREDQHKARARDVGVKKHSTKSKSSETVATSGYSFDQRRAYAEQQKPPLGKGWIVESAKGKYDELITAWLENQVAEKSLTTTEIKQHRLTPEEIAERAQLIRELIEGGYSLEQATKQFGAGIHAEDWQAIEEQATDGQKSPSHSESTQE